MPLLVTPRHLSERAELFHQLASLTAAGVGLISALEMLHKAPPAPSFRAPLECMLGTLRQHATFTEATQTLSPSWMPRFDRALIRAGEESGSLDRSFRLLADYYRERASLARQLLSSLFYPALILHFAILVFPTSLLTRAVWEGDVAGFLLAKASILLPLYGAILLLVYLSQAARHEQWRARLEQVLRHVPLLGAALANLALARLSVALENLLNAGVSVIEAWELAAAASGSPALRRIVLQWRPHLLAGLTPAEAVQASDAFPDLFTNLYSTGEITGQLDETLRRLHRHYQEEAARKLHALAQWTPRLVYFAIVLLIAYQVVSFWTGYFSQINELAL